MSYRVLAATCYDGDCPTFFVDDATGAVKVRGYDPDNPTREIDVVIPGPAWSQLVAQLPPR